MRKVIAWCVCFVPTLLLGQVQFPSVSVEHLTGETIQLPRDFEGKYCLIGMAARKRSEEELKTWQMPIYNKFILKTGLMDNLFDVQVCFLPLFTGAMKLAKNKVVQKLKENNEELVLDHVYVYLGDFKPFEQIGVTDKKTPYFYLLSPDGGVVWSGHGAFRQQYFDEIEEILTQ